MLATFNEILFKMPQANSMRFHVEMQLKNCSEESVLFPCLPWALLTPTQKAEGRFSCNRRWLSGFPLCF